MAIYEIQFCQRNAERTKRWMRDIKQVSLFKLKLTMISVVVKTEVTSIVPLERLNKTQGNPVTV